MATDTTDSGEDQELTEYDPSGSQFPSEDDRLPGGMHWRPYLGVDTNVYAVVINEGRK